MVWKNTPQNGCFSFGIGKNVVGMNKNICKILVRVGLKREKCKQGLHNYKSVLY